MYVARWAVPFAIATSINISVMFPTIIYLELQSGFQYYIAWYRVPFLVLACST